ncbi:Uu.00g008250.m01.CDS01 [Anthostomella pinea]|uniref:Molybdate-anion transporter n=1 Tax=Anthostomella pinea TaxID=933095 RepID=A0AAI8VX62_9PEZI|nr:Uu.00g008250.m01.CDS01 [Anthostomella pinea]
MCLDIYWISLLVLVPLVAFVTGRDFIIRPFHKKLVEKPMTWTPDEDARKFRWTFLQVYLVVMGSEWLQGPYLFSLFRNEKGLDEATIATLYICTYVSAAISAFFTGYVTDRFGRRAACLVFCGIHSLASASVCFDKLEVLILGRILSGIGLTLLWTAFESWMIAEYNARGLDQSSLQLSNMFGIMTTYNCITAILAGVSGHCIVLALGSKTDPFMVGLALDLCVAILMLYTWNENRGLSTSSKGTADVHDEEAIRTQASVDSDQAMALASLTDVRVWVLSFITCCFEGTIFLLMFFWPGTLQEAHDRDHPESRDAIPHGVIFAAFMAIMVLGALLFNYLTTNSGGRGKGHLVRFFNPTRLLSIALLLSAVSFLVAALTSTESHLFGAFLLLEACNGIYVPSVAYHRGVIVNEAGRASVYGLMNIPLFIFVVVALWSTGGSREDHRQIVFILCAALLLAAALMSSFGLDMARSPAGFSEVAQTNAEDVKAEVDGDAVEVSDMG